MNTQDFCYWLQGYFELSGTGGGLYKEQVKVIKEHLQLVFKKETVKEVPELTDEKLQDLKDRRLYGVGKYSKPIPDYAEIFKPRPPSLEITYSSQIKPPPTSEDCIRG